MELNLALQMLRRRWWLIIGPAVIVAFFAVPDLIRNEQTGSGGFSASFRYSAAQVQSNLPTRDGDYQDVWLASEFVVNAFTDWVRSSTFRAELQLIVGAEIDLALLGVAADNQRSIGQVSMTYPDAAILAQIANAAIAVLQTRNQVYFPHLGAAPAAVTIIDEPLVVPAPPPLTNRFAPLLQLGVALFAGLCIGLLAEYLDQTLRTVAEVEAQGLRVLAAIPKSR
jgi:capsular polysaccharide biosynthesis protein